MTKPPDAWLASITPVLATALDAVIVMGEDGLIVGWNAIAEKVFGWS
jgi:PAS domain-containing protein